MNINKVPFAKIFNNETYGQFLVKKNYDDEKDCFVIEIESQCLDIGSISINFNFNTEE
jgi:hypothetical protein